MNNRKSFNNEVLYTTDLDCTTIDYQEIQDLKEQSKENERKRIRLCTHLSPEDPLHEMFIIHTKETYVRPHKHLKKAESFYLLEGEATLIIFDDQGEIQKTIELGSYRQNVDGKKFYYRIEENIYHALIIHSDFVVFHEVTTGPFIRENTVFPEWAPNEQEIEKQIEFVQNLRNVIGGANNAES